MLRDRAILDRVVERKRDSPLTYVYVAKVIGVFVFFFVLGNLCIHTWPPLK